MQAACEWVHAQAAAAHSAKIMSGLSVAGSGGAGGGPAIPSKSEFNMWTNLVLESALRRLHSYSRERQVHRNIYLDFHVQRLALL